MADKFYFSRDTEVYLIKDSSKWLIPVLDGFSFSQGTNTSEITLNEMAAGIGAGAGKSRRSRQLFTDSYAPAEWSFQTYLRPFKSTNGATNGWEGSGSDDHQHCVEEALWACFMGAPTFTKTNGATEAVWSGGVTNSTNSVIFDMTGSEVAALATFDLFFEMGAASGSGETFYKLADCVVSSVSIDFDIDGIATATWSGNASMISDEAALAAGTIISEGTTATSNFIRNRLTQMTVTAADTTTFPGLTGSDAGKYDLVLTGGNITMENNISYLTPETLGVVNQPIGHVTGTRSVSGNFTCYLNNEQGGSADLFEDLIEATSVVTNSFNTVFKIGGASAPKVQIDLPKCHFEVPTHSIDDIISLETNFHALPASVDPGSTAGNYEAKVTYTGNTV